MNSIVVAYVRRDLRYGLCHCVWEIEELKEMTNGLAQEWEKWKKAIEQANILENLARQKHHSYLRLGGGIQSNIDHPRT